MNVGQLMELLSEYDPCLPVTVDDGRQCVIELEEIEFIHEWSWRKYDKDGNGTDEEGSCIFL